MQQCLKGKFILKFTSRNNNVTFWKRVLPTVDYDFTKHLQYKESNYIYVDLQPKLDRYRSFHHDHYYYHHYHLLKSTNLKFELKFFKCVLVKYEFDEDNFCFIIEGKIKI